jgi:hypothetical protein
MAVETPCIANVQPNIQALHRFIESPQKPRRQSNFSVDNPLQPRRIAPFSLHPKPEHSNDLAAKLSSNKIWYSHGRMIGMNTLKSVLRLDIDDFGLDAELSRSIRTYSDTLSEYLQRHGLDFFLYNRRVES